MNPTGSQGTIFSKAVAEIIPCVENFIDIIEAGRYRVELQHHRGQGCTLTLIINDHENRRIIKCPIIENGNLKFYPTVRDALRDAVKRIGRFKDPIPG